MNLLLLSLLFVSCLAELETRPEVYNVVEKLHRFLRPEEINGQVMSKHRVSLKPSFYAITTSGPNVFKQKLPKTGRRSNSMVSFILPTSVVRLPNGEKTTTHFESSYRLEASVPILANEQEEPIEEEETKIITTTQKAITKKVRQELDEQEEHEIDNELGSPGMSMRLTEDSTTTETPPRYKLIYFDMRGACESIRLIFRYANESFVDERLSKKQWLRMRGKTLFGKIPILEVEGGKQLGQCYAISRYLARKFGLCGLDEWDQAKVDEAAEFHRGVVNDLSSYIYVLGGFKEGNKDQLRKEVFLPTVEKNFPIYVKLLEESNSGFFGRAVSWVDFATSEFFTTIEEYEPFILKKYPKLVAFTARVHQLPQIRRYIRTRTKTPLRAL